MGALIRTVLEAGIRRASSYRINQAKVPVSNNFVSLAANFELHATTREVRSGTNT